ncbi:MAG: CBS domain-containing protein [archaeon]|nr:MAG: CBS domain-containing protein [archaeon]
MKEITVEDAMTKNIVKVDPDESIINVANKMKEKDIGSMLVCKNKKLVGLITSEDLVKRIIVPTKDAKNLKAKDVMTKKLVTASSDEDLAEAIRIMIDKSVQRLPVVDGNRLVGILTDGDILRMAPHLVESLVESRREMEGGMEGDACEVCGNYSENLRRVNGQWVCEECMEVSPDV